MTADAGGKVRDGGPPPVVDRITVALVRKAVEDLKYLQEETDLSKTDIVNRAISVYKFIEAEGRAGNTIYVRNDKTGETQMVRFL
jgi:hypothetical protein